MYFRVNSPAVPYIVLLYTGRPTAIYIYISAIHRRTAAVEPYDIRYHCRPFLTRHVAVRQFFVLLFYAALLTGVPGTYVVTPHLSLLERTYVRTYLVPGTYFTCVRTWHVFVSGTPRSIAPPCVVSFASSRQQRQLCVGACVLRWTPR